MVGVGGGMESERGIIQIDLGSRAFVVITKHGAGLFVGSMNECGRKTTAVCGECEEARCGEMMVDNVPRRQSIVSAQYFQSKWL